MDKKKIKRVVRKYVQETNSSSSHSLVISMSGDLIKQGDPDFDLDIRDGVLYVPCRKGDFVWGYEKSNSPLTKLQYAAGLMCCSIDGIGDHKKIKKFKNILTSYLGISDVVFEWDTDYFEALKTAEDKDDVYRRVPDIDHQSFSDSLEEISESRETLLRFIFSRDSWWYGGNDNSDEPRNFKEETEITRPDPVAIASVEFGGEIGRVDFELYQFPCDIYQELEEDPDTIIRNLKWSKKENKMITNFVRDINYLPSRLDVFDEEHLVYSGESYIKDGIPYLIFSGGKKWEDRFHELQKKLMEEKNKNHWQIIAEVQKTLLESDDFNEGEDYKLFPISIESFEFGKIC